MNRFWAVFVGMFMIDFGEITFQLFLVALTLRHFDLKMQLVKRVFSAGWVAPSPNYGVRGLAIGMTYALNRE